jgi:ribonucleoside-diphosphate reductase beta chain
MSYSVFDVENQKSHLGVRAFFDDPPTIARYDQVKYPWIEKLTRQQVGFFWVPEEIELYRDSKDFKNLSDHERHIFTSNLKRQILLDSVQGRAPTAAFGSIASLPELETWIQTWTWSETIHSRSYTHIIRNVYSEPGKVFDEITDIGEIVDCARDISEHYDRLINESMRWHLRNSGISPHSSSGHLMELKKLLWLALMSVNILEGIRFYVSFCCSWNFAELKRMEGSAKIIKLIARDEALHLSFTQHLLKTLPKDDPDFEKIRVETQDQCVGLFQDAVDQEKQWARYLFKDGSMIGLNERLLCDYMEWIGNKRLSSVGLPRLYKTGENPLPWTQAWIMGGEVQVAPQEVSVVDYTSGDINMDVDDDTFNGMSL